MKNKSSSLSMMEIFIPCFYILGQYQLGNQSLGLIVLFIMVVYGIIKKKYIQLYKPLVLLVVFMIIHDVIKAVVFLNTASFPVNTWIERVIYIVFLAQCINQVNEDNLYKVWKIIGIFAMAGLLYHAILVYGLGQSVSMIKILPLTSESISFTNIYARPRSFFLEPASYVTWILPLLYMSLKREKYLFASAVTISIFLSTSTTGVLMSAVLWGSFLLISKRITTRKKVCLFAFIIIVAIGLVNLPVFQKTMEKINNIDFSSNIRITAGLDVYRDADIVTQLFGIKYNTTEQYFLQEITNLGKYNMTINAHWLGFVNAFARSLLMYGIIGGILYLNVFYRIFKDGKREIMPYLIICFASIFGQSVFFNSFFLMQFAILLGTNEIEKNTIGVRIR